jgi:hypothetical protein
MTYEQVKHLKPGEFKRLCGVRPETFAKMLEIMRLHTKPKKKAGRPTKLSLEDELLLSLEYWREYRTYFHIGQSWGVDESTAYRIIRKVEDTLIRSKAIALPGKKQLTECNYQGKVVVIDVTESPIERPKKNKNASIVARKNVTPSSPRSW